MKRAEEGLKKEGILEDARIVLQVHDELVYEIKENKLEKAKNIIIKAMTEAIISDDFLVNMTPVPLIVSSDAGFNWGELK
jgi:DNA polymerase-1